MQRIVPVLCAFLLIHASVACSSNFKNTPTYPHEDEAFSEVASSPPGLANDPPPEFVLLPGDTITVRSISNESSEYGGLVVDSEGKVHVPVIGAVHVEGVAPHVAERSIEAKLQKVDRFVRVTVLVTSWGGHNATVIGAVASEGPKPVTPGMRLAELVAAAGGPLRSGGKETSDGTYAADLENARLMRGGKALPISLAKALAGDPRHNVRIHAGDELFVPPGLGNRIAVLGTVGGGGALLTYHSGFRLTEALALAGGVNIDSDYRDIRIVRGPLRNPLFYQYDFGQLIRGKATDVELAPGDVVWVDRHWAARMTDVIDRITPLLALMITGLSVYVSYQNLKILRRQERQLNRLEDATQ